MISREEHEELMKKWPGRIYATPGRVGPRLRHLEGLLPMLRGEDVLELGANAGLHALEIGCKAHSYTGVEPDENYRKQFEITMQADLGQPMCPWDLKPSIESLDLINCQSAGMYDALVCCVALYLLSEDELRILKECDFDLIIIQERVAGRDKKGNTTNGLHTPKAITKWMNDMGLVCSEYWDRKHKFFEIVGH